MNYADVVDVVSRLGFPIVVAGYLLIKVTSTLERLDKSITALTAAIDNMLYIPGKGVIDDTRRNPN